MVIFTKGKDGAEIYTKDKVVSIEGNVVEVVDTTGAGDTYIGYFVKGILEGFSLVESANLATKASAIAVTRFGAVDSIPSYDEVK